MLRSLVIGVEPGWLSEARKAIPRGIADLGHAQASTRALVLSRCFGTVSRLIEWCSVGFVVVIGLACTSAREDPKQSSARFRLITTNFSRHKRVGIRLYFKVPRTLGACACIYGSTF